MDSSKILFVSMFLFYIILKITYVAARVAA